MGAVLAEDRHAAMRILEIEGDEFLVHERDALENVVGLRDDLLPALSGLRLNVDRDHPVAGSVLVGAEIEKRTVVSQELVAGVEVVEEPHHFTA